MVDFCECSVGSDMSHVTGGCLVYLVQKNMVILSLMTVSIVYTKRIWSAILSIIQHTAIMLFVLAQ